MAVSAAPHRRIIAAALLVLTASCSNGGSDHADAARHHGLVDPASVMGVPDRVASGAQGRVPQFVVSCTFSHAAPDDPIVFPGQEGASHMHVFFGNRTTNASSTYDTMIGGATSCEQSRDTASYWAPALLDESGRMIEPVKAVAYYRPGPDIDATTVQPYPKGLMMIAGDFAATKAQPVSIVAWSCGVGAERESLPPKCTTKSTLRMLITFPDCWNGVDLDVAGHRDHLRYSSGGVCPESHPVPIPQLTLTIIYPYVADPSQLSLASGSIITGHADFLNSWDQDKLVLEVDSCLHREVVCGVSSDK